MLKNKNVKVIIGVIVALVALIASSIWVLSSMKENSVDEFNYENLAATANAANSLTQIDHIIQNSLSTEDGNDNKYHVTIIHPDTLSVETAVSAFFTDGQMKDYVINGYRTIDELMADNMIDVTTYSASSLKSKTTEELSTLLGKSDMIYLYAKSQDNKDYTGNNALSENLYEYLHNYAFGANKPLLINYYMSKDNGGNSDIVPSSDVGNTNIFKLTTSDFKNSWRNTNTLNVSDWKDGSTDSQLFDNGTETGMLVDFVQSIRSGYVSYSLENNACPRGYDSWDVYWKRLNPAGDRTLNILYIHDGTPDVSVSTLEHFGAWMLGDGKTSVFSGNMDNAPDHVAVTSVPADANITRNTFYGVDNVKKYDFIFIAPGTHYNTTNGDISADARRILNDLSTDKNGLTYILFGTLSSGSTSGGTNTEENLIIDTSTNFGKLVDLSITTTGYSKKSNILVVGTEFMKTVASDPEKNPTKIGKIVSWLNKSTFRKISGSGGGASSGSVSTTAFRVLELQPCYPIDLEMALNSSKKSGLTNYNGTNGEGNYYTVPANVLNTSELDNYVDSATGKMKSEYYQWDLTKAKLSYALNIPADNIELVQMSTEEFITSKADVTDSYDLIYIGGNKSALKASGLWNKYPYPQNDENLVIGTNAPDAQKAVRNTASYTMYSHTGEIAGLISGQTFNFARTYQSTVLNGNDITYDRLESLKAYIDSGMPIVFSNEVWTAYQGAKTDGYANKYIDPDSNMYALMKYADSKNKFVWDIKTPYSSSDYRMVDYWILDSAKLERISNDSGVYGTASMVEVFNTATSDALYQYVYSGNINIRPKFTFETNAVAYSDSDASTELETRDLKWTVELFNPIAGHKYAAMLLHDDDDNAEFDLSEEAITDSVLFVDNKAELTYTYPSDDFGAFSWKIVVADITNATGASITEDIPATGYSAISMIARSEDQDKKSARILEIMPIVSSKAGGQDGHTLYLDSNIQQAQGTWRFRYCDYLNEDGTINTNNPYGYEPATNSTGGYYEYETISFTEYGKSFGGLQLGLYQPKLSLNRYDSANNLEDWNYNYVDLIADDFDLSFDVMYVDEINYYAEKSRTLTDAQRTTYQNLAKTEKTRYDAYSKQNTVQYEALAEVEGDLKGALEAISKNTFTLQVPNRYNPSEMVTYTAANYNTTDIDGIIRTGNYFRFFFENSGYNDATVAFYNEYYKPYIEVHNQMIDAYRKYVYYSMMSYGPDEYLRKNYDVVVIGFYDDANGQFVDFSTDACEDLKSFLDKDGSLLMTHDNMTKDIGIGAVNLTTTLRDYAGMNRFGTVTIESGTENTDLPHYITTDTDKYFFSNLSLVSGQELGKTAANVSATEWNERANAYKNSRGGIINPYVSSSSTYKFGYPGYTDCFSVYETNQALAMPYIYSQFQIEEQIKWNIGTGSLRITGTTKATQVNRGVVTTYPYYVASDLRISPTHNQAYSLDLEDDQVTVWYTFAADSVSDTGVSGGTNYQFMKENSSLYAASPKDGMDSYFIYSIGNVTYCGAGHSLVTGDQRDNNDERKLFLNVLVNMASKADREPAVEDDIILYDPDGKTKAPGNVVKFDLVEDQYYIDVTSRTAYPEFGFKVGKKLASKISKVEIFYDLDYGLNANGTMDDLYTNNVDQYIANLTYQPVEDLTAEEEAALTDEQRAARNAQIKANEVITSLRKGNVQIVDALNFPSLSTQLKLLDNGTYLDYFKPYGGDYTYIVIRVTSSDGGVETVVTKRIRVNLTRDLLDLT